MTMEALYRYYGRETFKAVSLLLPAYLMLWLIAFSLGITTIAQGSEPGSHKRIVAIGGSVTEIIFALGEESRLIARDSTSLFPPQATGLPDVGYIRRLSPEGVLSVEPDLILALEGAGPPETVSALAAAGVPFVLIPEGYTAQKIEQKIITVGDALGASEKAQKLVEKTRAAIKSSSADSGAATNPKKVLFVLSMRGGKILASGKATAAHGILTLSGAKNAMNSFDGYKPVSDEAVIAAAPDVILMMNRRGDHGASDEKILAHPAIKNTPAGKNRRILRMDGLLLLGFGPRTAEAISKLKNELMKVAR